MAYREIRGLLRYLPMASLPPWREPDCVSAKLLQLFQHLRLKIRLQKPQILVSLTHGFGQQIGSAFVAVLSILPVVVHVARFYFSQGLPGRRQACPRRRS